MATIVWDPRVDLHRPRRQRRPRCTGAPVAPGRAVAQRRRAEARAADRCRARSRRALAAGVGVGVAVAGALALALVPGSDGPSAPAEPGAPMEPVSVSPSGADPEVGGTYRLIDRALAGSGEDVSGLVAGLEGAAGE